MGPGPSNPWNFTPAERFSLRNWSWWKGCYCLCLICFEFGHVVVSTSMIGMFCQILISFCGILHQPRIQRCKRRSLRSFAENQFWYLGAMGQKAHVSWSQSGFPGQHFRITFTSSYPHHDMYTFCYWQIFWHSIWHSIWHIFWHSTWHIFWHMFWHIFWHPIWHSIWHIFWHITWQIFWHSIWQTFWHLIWHIFWHSIWHFIWHSIWHTFWHSIWHIFWHSIWHVLWRFIWHIFWHSIWHSIWHLSWHSIWPVRSSTEHWAGKVPGWGPAVRTELGRSQVEVQRCALSWEGPRLRPSGAHWAGKVPGWGPAVRTELGRSQVEVQQCALSSEVGEELGEELARRKWRWKLMQTWSRRNWRRRRRRRIADS